MDEYIEYHQDTPGDLTDEFVDGLEFERRILLNRLIATLHRREHSVEELIEVIQKILDEELYLEWSTDSFEEFALCGSEIPRKLLRLFLESRAPANTKEESAARR